VPQAVEFDIPFEPQVIGPDIDQLRDDTVAWAQSFGLMRSPETVARMLDWGLAEIAARFHPTAEGEDLLLGSCLQYYLFLFDDQFDSPDGLRPEVLQATRQLIGLLHEAPGTRPAYATPATLAWADIWVRACEGMSAAWRARAAREWATYLVGNLAEAFARRHGTPNSLEEYLLLRRQTIATYPVYDMSERVQHFEIPLEAFHTPQIQEMRSLGTDVVTLCNDVASLEKEECRDEPLNSVLLLERSTRLGRDEAVQQIVDLVRCRVDKFLVLQNELGDVADVLGLTADERLRVDRYVREALHSMMRGNYDWQLHTSRYCTTSKLNMRPGDIPAYIDDTVSPDMSYK
jgi:hypothetical protein